MRKKSSHQQSQSGNFFFEEILYLAWRALYTIKKQDLEKAVEALIDQVYMLKTMQKEKNFFIEIDNREDKASYFALKTCK